MTNMNANDSYQSVDHSLGCSVSSTQPYLFQIMFTFGLSGAYHWPLAIKECAGVSCSLSLVCYLGYVEWFDGNAAGGSSGGKQNLATSCLSAYRCGDGFSPLVIPH